MMKGSLGDFSKWTNQLSLSLTVVEQTHPVYIVAVKISITRFVNDAR